MTARNYANAPATTLSASITSGQTSITITSATGYPATPFVAIIDPDTTSEEVVLVTNVSGTTLTVTRAYDSSTAHAHGTGAAFVHGFAAIDAREANAHVNATSSVHGVSGDVLGTTDTQSVSNKDLSSATNTFPSSLATDTEVTSAVSTHAALTATHGATGAVVGTTNSQTLTNKTLTSPVINGAVTGTAIIRGLQASGTLVAGTSSVVAVSIGTTMANANYGVFVNPLYTGSAADINCYARDRTTTGFNIVILRAAGTASVDVLWLVVA